MRNAQLENQKIMVHEWFETKEFSFEEKIKIHSEFVK
ncbi:MAG: hypothetical protein ACI849_001148 [Patiriisocius sp.]